MFLFFFKIQSSKRYIYLVLVNFFSLRYTCYALVDLGLPYSSQTAFLFLLSLAICSSIYGVYQCHSVQFSSVAQSCPTLSNLMNHSTPGLPVQHQLPEFTQTRVHRVSDAIQPSHPLSSPSPPAPNPSQHQSLFQ